MSSNRNSKLSVLCWRKGGIERRHATNPDADLNNADILASTVPPLNTKTMSKNERQTSEMGSRTAPRPPHLRVVGLAIRPYKSTSQADPSNLKARWPWAAIVE